MNGIDWNGMTSKSSPNQGRSWFGWGTIEGFHKYRMAKDDSKYVFVPPTVENMVIRKSRIQVAELPAGRMQQICSDDKFERLLHSRGRDVIDLIENVQGKMENPVDLVAFPENEDDILKVLTYCSEHNVACIPFGGGSSVCFGVNPPDITVTGMKGTISLDMCKLNKVLEVDLKSMAARIQGGTYGPDLEEQLKQHGVSMRHYPQSFEFSTFGGWIATRGGGHFATLLTHVDEMIESVKVVTPAGITETRRLPASGAGPSEFRHYVGSEGIYGIISEGWTRVIPRPTARASATVIFLAESSRAAFLKGEEAVRQVVQSGVHPANLRLMDGKEIAMMTGLSGLDQASVLLISFESAHRDDLNADMDHVLNIVERCDGMLQGDQENTRTKKQAGQRSGIGGEWGKAFMAGGYRFTEAVMGGLLLNTFETAITWDKFQAFYEEVNQVADQLIKEITKSKPNITSSFTCRLTHVYPDGPAPYFTLRIGDDEIPYATSVANDDRVKQWLKFKNAVTQVMIKHGAASTHHHAVGKLHRPHYEVERGALFTKTLQAIKTVNDPKWILNPDVLIRHSEKSKL